MARVENERSQETTLDIEKEVPAFAAYSLQLAERLQQAITMCGEPPEMGQVVDLSLSYRRRKKQVIGSLIEQMKIDQKGIAGQVKLRIVK